MPERDKHNKNNPASNRMEEKKESNGNKEKKRKATKPKGGTSLRRDTTGDPAEHRNREKK